jgi:hypothetical protein
MNIELIVNQASLHICNVIEKMNKTFLLQESNFCISQSGHWYLQLSDWDGRLFDCWIIDWLHQSTKMSTTVK